MAKTYTDLITSAHRGKPKFTAMVAAVSGMWGNNFDLVSSMNSYFELNIAAGKQLETVGEWVGQSRVIPKALPDPYFGFSDNPLSLGFGEELDLSEGGIFYSEGDAILGTTVLDDATLRTLIKGKISRNLSTGTTLEMEEAMQAVFNAPCRISDPGTMVIELQVGRILTAREEAVLILLDAIPRPVGVYIGSITNYIP